MFICYTIPMDKAKKILVEHFSVVDWEIVKPQYGSKKECYIATHNDKKVFIKFKVNIDALTRLAELKIAPNILAAGKFEEENYVIQEYFDGEHPSREWITNNMDKVGMLIKTYHSDEQLISLLTANRAYNYETYILRETSLLNERLQKLTDQSLKNENVKDTLEQFLLIKDNFAQVDLVPVHDEPNTSNMLINSDKILFIDWDDITLADPLRDIGPFLWWYLPESTWEDFLLLQSITLSEEVRNKIYWFAARASLEVAIWHRENGYEDDKGFLKDFIAAAHSHSNPRNN